MESESWSRFVAAAVSAKHHHHHQQPRYDPYLGLEEIGGEDEQPHRAEFPCPFCSEDFDVIGLCCHIDEDHPLESKKGVCPLCSARVGMDIVGHITAHHGSFFKMQRKRRFRKGSSGSHSAISFLRKELRDGNLQALLGSSSFVPTPAVAPDPFLSSLIYTLPVADLPKGAESEHIEERCTRSKNLDEKVEERPSCWEPSLSQKDHQERISRSEFVQGVLLSTIFDDM